MSEEQLAEAWHELEEYLDQDLTFEAFLAIRSRTISRHDFYRTAEAEAHYEEERPRLHGKRRPWWVWLLIALFIALVVLMFGFVPCPIMEMLSP